MDTIIKRIINISVGLPTIIAAIVLPILGYPVYVAINNLGWATYSVAGGLLAISGAMLYVEWKKEIPQQAELTPFRQKMLSIRKNSTLMIRILLTGMALWACVISTKQNIVLFGQDPQAFYSPVLALQLFMGFHVVWLFKDWAWKSLNKYIAMMAGDDSPDGPPMPLSKGWRKYFTKKEFSNSFTVAIVLMITVYGSIIFRGYPLALGLTNFAWIILPISIWYLAALVVFIRKQIASHAHIFQPMAPILIAIVVIYMIWFTVSCNISEFTKLTGL